MKDKDIIIKALLECYIYIDDMHDALGKSIDKCVRNGFYSLYHNDTESIYGQIIDYTYRRDGLYNMKYLIEEGLRGCEANYVQLLQSKYFAKMTMQQISNLLFISVRTAYRQFFRGLNAFLSALKKLGFNEDRIADEFKDEPLFTLMVKKLKKEAALSRGEDVSEYPEDNNIIGNEKTAKACSDLPKYVPGSASNSDRVIAANKFGNCVRAASLMSDNAECDNQGKINGFCENIEYWNECTPRVERKNETHSNMADYKYKDINIGYIKGQRGTDGYSRDW